MLAAMNMYWEEHPPVHIMVAAYLGLNKKTGSAADTLEATSEFVPVSSVSPDEFNNVLASFGLLST